jgi:dihydrofolate reductase
MTRLTVTENITLDGVIEQLDDWFSPSGAEGEVDDSDIVATIQQQMSAQAALLLGRKTFESFRGYWPLQTDDRTGITRHLNQVRKYVLSSTIDEPQWENTTVLRGTLAEEVGRLKQQVDGEIGVTGSITLVHGLVAAGLIDEYRLFLYPVVAGRGRRMFENATGMPRLELVAAKPFRSGIVLLSYRPTDT